MSTTTTTAPTTPLLPHVIEAARTGRSACRGCKQAIGKGVLRLGVASPQEHTGFSTAWWHLECAADQRPWELQEALLTTSTPVLDRSALEQRLAAPAAALAALPTPRAARIEDTACCDACSQWSFPNMLWVLAACDVPVGGQSLRRAARYHPGCARAVVGDVLATIEANSQLSDEERSWLRDDFVAGAQGSE